jgi:hypothetical protein
MKFSAGMSEYSTQQLEILFLAFPVPDGARAFFCFDIE